MSLFRFLSNKVGTGSGSIAGAHTVATSSSPYGAVAGGHGHDSHVAPWEGVNLWRTPFKGDTDTVTQVKRTKGTLDRYVENRVRRIQQLQIEALRNKTTPTWVMMPRDRLLLAAQGIILMNPPNKSSTIDGWNDPPANLALSDNMSTKRVLLNKRVPHTNQDPTSTNNPSNILTAPPICSPSTTSTPISLDNETSSKNDLLTIEEMNEIFKKQLKKLEDSSSVEKKILEDIYKKFQVMHDEWCQDKLSLNTKQTLSNIFRELDSNHVQQAFDMHVVLVRNASSEVVRFIVGIKRLIQELQRLSN
ncbi:unnamed protein product [Rotaria sp. Silwood1]|nr:unnamed protein product [Rotaria sp. Silwood1]CAF3350322.1 unnamed protein product [Rotaria sp. Silwood1]CAF4607256.1 unnamed protein product [Rotaria sp. Silwood1]